MEPPGRSQQQRALQPVGGVTVSSQRSWSVRDHAGDYCAAEEGRALCIGGQARGDAFRPIRRYFGGLLDLCVLAVPSRPRRVGARACSASSVPTVPSRCSRSPVAQHQDGGQAAGPTLCHADLSDPLGGRLL